MKVTISSADDPSFGLELIGLFLIISTGSGADPGFFLGGGALVSCSTSTPINQNAEYQLY